jgi:hypothetical protein
MDSCPDSGRTQHLLMADTRKSVRLLQRCWASECSQMDGVPSKLILFVEHGRFMRMAKRRDTGTERDTRLASDSDGEADLRIEAR